MEDIFSITRVEDIILLAGKTYFLYNHNLYTNIFRTGIGLKVSSKITRVEDSFSFRFRVIDTFLEKSNHNMLESSKHNINSMKPIQSSAP